MSFFSEWHIGECLEWYTDLPTWNMPRESPVFLIQNSECYFQFQKIDFTYYLYLKRKMTCIRLKSFQLIIYSDHTGTTSGGIFFRYFVNFCDFSRCILQFYESCFANRGQISQYGPFVRFCFMFKNGNGPSFSLGKKNGKLSLFC